MATVNKDFKIKSGLIVEGTNATVNGYDILTKKQADQDYIIDLIGGSATSNNTPDTVVLRDENGDFAAGTITADIVGDVTGNADTATALETARTISLAGDATGSVSFDGTANAQITVTLDSSFATDAEVATAKGEAISTASSDATSKANAAQSAAEATAAADATTKANAAENAAKAYTDARETAITTAYQSYADTSEADAKAYADQKVADLVDSAPALLDTLNELAAAIGDDANFAANLATSVGEKVAKAGDTMTGALVLHADPVNNLEAATKAYVDTAASTAQSNAEDYADGLAGNYEVAGAALAAQTAAEGYASGLDSATNTRIDNLDTDDVAEGTRLYFTDARAKNSAADLLTGATLSNITITGSGSGLTITAENGVAQSTTDDLAEGVNSLYFTDQRALDAVSGSNIQPESVDITWVRREEATWTNVPTASTATVHSFGANKGSVKYLVRVISGSFSHVTEILATTDASNNVAVVEYGTIYTSENPLATATVVWDGQSAYNLNVTTANNNSEVLVAATLLAYND